MHRFIDLTTTLACKHLLLVPL